MRLIQCNILKFQDKPILRSSQNSALQHSLFFKASRSSGLIKRNLWNCPRKVRETAYTSIVRPKLEYASASWDPHYKKDISTLERVQRKAARFCLQNFSKTAGVTDMLPDLKWDTLETRRKKNRLTLMYKLSHNLVDINAEEHLIQTVN